MIKLTITQLGTPKDVETKFGTKQKNYLKATEYGDTFLNYWVSPATKDWKVGQVIEVESVEKRDYTGQDGTLRTSHDIKMPKFNGIGAEVQKILEEINGKLTIQGLALREIAEWVRKQDKRPEVVPGTDIPYPQ